MPGLSRDDRRALAQQLSSWIEVMLADERNEVEYRVMHGMHIIVADDLEAGTPAPNGSATLVVHINGGARHTTGFADDRPTAL